MDPKKRQDSHYRAYRIPRQRPSRLASDVTEEEDDDQVAAEMPEPASRVTPQGSVSVSPSTARARTKTPKQRPPTHDSSGMSKIEKRAARREAAGVTRIAPYSRRGSDGLAGKKQDDSAIKKRTRREYWDKQGGGQAWTTPESFDGENDDSPRHDSPERNAMPGAYRVYVDGNGENEELDNLALQDEGSSRPMADNDPEVGQPEANSHEHSHPHPGSEYSSSLMGEHENQKSQKRPARCWIIIGLVLVAAVGAAVGLGVGLSAGSQSKGEVELSPSRAPATTSPLPTSPCRVTVSSAVVTSCVCGGFLVTTQPLRDMHEGLLNLYSSVILPGFAAPEPNSCSPRSLALYWVAEQLVEGTAMPPSDSSSDPVYRQWASRRYILALLFLHWTELSVTPWKSQDLWLTAEDECTWEGVVCIRRLGFDVDIGSIRLPNYFQASFSIPSEITSLTQLSK